MTIILVFIASCAAGFLLGCGIAEMLHFYIINRRSLDDRGTQQPTYDRDGNFTGWLK